MSERAYPKSPSQSDPDNTVVVYTDRADCHLEELRKDEGQAQSAELESLQFRYDELLREHDQLRSTLWQLEAANLDNIPQDKVTDAEAGTLYGELIYAIEQWIYNLSLTYSQSHWQRLYSTHVHGAMEDRTIISMFPRTVQGHTAQNLKDLEGTEHLDLFFMTCFITETIANEILEENHPYGLGREQIKFIEETERSMKSVLKWDELKVYKWRLNTYLGAMRSASFSDIDAKLRRLTHSICSRLEEWMRSSSKHGEARVSRQAAGQLRDGILRAAVELQHKVSMSPDRYDFWVPALDGPVDAQNFDCRDIGTWTKPDSSPHGTTAVGVLYPGLKHVQPDAGYYVITRPEVVTVRTIRPGLERLPPGVSSNAPSANAHVITRAPAASPPPRVSRQPTFWQRLTTSSTPLSVSYSRGPPRSVEARPSQ